MVPSNARPRLHVRFLPGAPIRFYGGGDHRHFGPSRIGCRDSHPTKISPTPTGASHSCESIFWAPVRTQPQETRQVPVPEDPVGSHRTTPVDLPMALLPFPLTSRTARFSCPSGPPS